MNRGPTTSGTTTHGVQGRGPLAGEPAAYYGEAGPVGDVLRAAAARHGALDVAIVGLGAGAMALHGEPGWRMTFYEMDPTVVDIARDPRLFTCLERSAAETDVVLGDGRLALTGSDARYDLVMLDAFSSDAVPVHLLTLEAVQAYREHLRPGGLLLFNVSNDYVHLAQILAAAAQELGLVALGVVHLVEPRQLEEHLHYPSMWVLLAPSRDDIDPEHFGPGWGWLTPEPHVRPWTDDVSSLLEVVGGGS